MLLGLLAHEIDWILVLSLPVDPLLPGKDHERLGNFIPFYSYQHLEGLFFQPDFELK